MFDDLWCSVAPTYPFHQPPRRPEIFRDLIKIPGAGRPGTTDRGTLVEIKFPTIGGDRYLRPRVIGHWYEDIRNVTHALHKQHVPKSGGVGAILHTGQVVSLGEGGPVETCPASKFAQEGNEPAGVKEGG